MLTERWQQLRRHEDHDTILKSDARFILMRAGRRSGKTEISKRKLVQSLASVGNPYPDPKYFYAGPTRQQAKDVAWADLKALTPPEWMAGRPSETELKITTKFGSTLQIFGLDQPQRIEGKGYDGGVVDEMSDVKPNALTTSIFPAMADRHGWLYLIGVPKRAGRGAIYFNNLFDEAMKSGTFPGTDDRVEAYSWESSTVLSEADLAFFKGIMSPDDFDEQFRAILQRVGGQVFHAFGDWNIAEVHYRPELPIIVGMDFNITPHCWVLCHEIDGQLCQFGEVYLKNSNTVAMLDHIAERYGFHDSGWLFYGDASSRARKTSASKTDYLLILADERFRNKKVIIPKSNPKILDRIACCNALFYSANGEVRYQVDESNEHTIKDLLIRAFKQDVSPPQLDDGPMVGHISDALGYIIVSRYPIQMPRAKGKAGIGLF